MEDSLQEFPVFVDVDAFPLQIDGGISAGTAIITPPSTAHCRCKCNFPSVKSQSQEPESHSERHLKKPNRQYPPALSPSFSDPDAPPMTSSVSLSGFSVIPLAPMPTRRVPDSYTPPRLSAIQTQKLPLVAQSPPDDAKIGGSSSMQPKSPVSIEIPREESSRTQRWQMMKDRLKEMNEWVDEMQKSKEISVAEDPAKDDDEDENGEGELEESVWVEKKGKCITVHFKCPCSKGYEIVLSGGLCYYKLTM